jgi:hypothetical protein
MPASKKALEKVDFKKDFKELFAPPSKAPVFVDVPAFKYILIDGRGYPGTSKDFQDKVGVLYGLVYTIKFALKLDKARPFEFGVAPLSGLYHADDPAVYMDASRREEWTWTLGIPVPDRVTAADFEKARVALKEKKNPPFVDKARFEIVREGKAAQVMHIGPYSAEAPTITMLHEFFRGRGYAFNGPHHEIYLGDPRRTAPVKLRTIIRQPVRKA